MKVPIWVLMLLLALVGGLLFSVFYEASAIPDYTEAESLFPVVAEFGRDLVALTQGREIELDDLRALRAEERFQAIRPYGIVPSESPEFLLSLRINKTFSFHIDVKGWPHWEKRVGFRRSPDRGEKY